ncbi:hypothetical protein QFZ66_005569 [Streptomyces sp. B4I13]|nr:hypothetical protein [Streptomyces sp. B4I13]
MTPASAIGTVPVPVPPDGVEKSLDVELPTVGGEIPLPTPGAPEGPRFVEGRLIPARVVLRLPVAAGLPGPGPRAPLPEVLGTDFDHVGLDAPAQTSGPSPCRVPRGGGPIEGRAVTSRPVGRLPPRRNPPDHGDERTRTRSTPWPSAPTQYP